MADLLTFPLAVVDFEASSLSDERSYPIEVGLAVARESGSPLEVWSSLIRPTPDWVERGHWSAASAGVHGISHAELANAPPAREVAEELGRLTAGLPVVWCDGGPYDGHWLRRLSRASGVEPAFQLRDIAALFVLDRRAHNRFATALDRVEPAHRAGPDAQRICTALVAAFSTQRGRSG